MEAVLSVRINDDLAVGLTGPGQSLAHGRDPGGQAILAAIKTQDGRVQRIDKFDGP